MFNINFLIELFSAHMSVMILGLLLVKITKLNPQRFVMLYTILGALQIVILKLSFPDFNMVPVILALCFGLLLMIIIAGIKGTSFGSANYESILVGYGLFPYYLGFYTSLIYIILSLLFIAIHSQVSISRAFKKIDKSKIPIKKAREKFSNDEYNELKKYGSIIFAMPMLFAAIVTALSISLQ